MSTNQAALGLIDQTSAPGQLAGANSETHLLEQLWVQFSVVPALQSALEVQSDVFLPDPELVLNLGLTLHQDAAGRSRTPVRGNSWETL